MPPESVGIQSSSSCNCNNLISSIGRPPDFLKFVPQPPPIPPQELFDDLNEYLSNNKLDLSFILSNSTQLVNSNSFLNIKCVQKSIINPSYLLKNSIQMTTTTPTSPSLLASSSNDLIMMMMSSSSNSSIPSSSSSTSVSVLNVQSNTTTTTTQNSFLFITILITVILIAILLLFVLFSFIFVYLTRIKLNKTTNSTSTTTSLSTTNDIKTIEKQPPDLNINYLLVANTARMGAAIHSGDNGAGGGGMCPVSLINQFTSASFKANESNDSIVIPSMPIMADNNNSIKIPVETTDPMSKLIINNNSNNKQISNSDLNSFKQSNSQLNRIKLSQKLAESNNSSSSSSSSSSTSSYCSQSVLINNSNELLNSSSISSTGSSCKQSALTANTLITSNSNSNNQILFNSSNNLIFNQPVKQLIPGQSGPVQPAPPPPIPTNNCTRQNNQFLLTKRIQVINHENQQHHYESIGDLSQFYFDVDDPNFNNIQNQIMPIIGCNLSKSSLILTPSCFDQIDQTTQQHLNRIQENSNYLNNLNYLHNQQQQHHHQHQQQQQQQPQQFQIFRMNNNNNNNNNGQSQNQSSYYLNSLIV